MGYAAAVAVVLLASLLAGFVWSRVAKRRGQDPKKAAAIGAACGAVAGALGLAIAKEVRKRKGGR